MTMVAATTGPVTAAGLQPEPMTLCRNETESLCLKAARRAGLSWGMAKEAEVCGFSSYSPKLAHGCQGFGEFPTPVGWQAAGSGWHQFGRALRRFQRGFLSSGGCDGTVAVMFMADLQMVARPRIWRFGITQISR